MRKLLSILALVLLSLVSVSLVSATYVPGQLQVSSVKVNGDEVNLLSSADLQGNTVDTVGGVSVEEGETLKVRVGLEALGHVEEVQVEAEISGYEFSDTEPVQDSSPIFDIEGVPAGTTRHVDLELNLPKQLEKDRYLLRVRVTDKDNTDLTGYVVLQLEPKRHGLDIKDVVFSPGTTVKAGRSLLTSVLLENFGDKDEKNVKVTVEVPQLGIKASEFVDQVKTDDHNVDYEDVPEMFLAIPSTAAEGDYDVKVSAQFKDLRDTVSKTFSIHVMPNEMFQKTEKLVLAVGPETQSVAAGKTATYAVALTNAGTASKAYTVEAVTGNWATAKVSDNLVVLDAGKSKVVYVEVTAAADAAAGEHATAVSVKSGEDVLQTVSFKANVVASAPAQTVSLRNGLEIALIVLVVLLILIGLVIGFSRMRKDEEGEQKSYY